MCAYFAFCINVNKVLEVYVTIEIVNFIKKRRNTSLFEFLLGFSRVTFVFKPTITLSQSLIKCNRILNMSTGSTFIVSKKGNEFFDYRTMQANTGDLEVVVQVTNTDKYHISRNGASMTILMNPTEVLEGFSVEEELFNYQWIKIDRREKLTLPGKKTRLKNLGWPSIDGGIHSQNDLLIRFELDAVEHVHAKYTEKDALLNDIGENQITSTSPRTYLDEFIVRSTKYRKIIPDADKLSLIQYLLIEEQDWGK